VGEASGPLRLRTAAWYGDYTVDLRLPETWQTSVYSPTTPRALTDAAIIARLEAPLGQPPIRERCTDRTRPLIIVDDLNRPTPAARILPVLVRQFTDAGVAPSDVTILVGPGTHGAPSASDVVRKVGVDLVRECRVRAHDSHQPVVKIGTTSFGTPVLVPQEVVASDFVVGVGGVYPNHTGGFGGGSKAALGILGLRSIAALHFGHESVGWGSRAANDTFRRDLDEIARLIGLDTAVLVVVDGERQVVDLACGDVHAVYPQFLASSKQGFVAPRPDPGVDVVISNAYPNDLSLTFVRMKGMFPLGLAPPGASRIVVASCIEGLGFHGLFPFMNAPRFHRPRMLAYRLAANRNKPRRVASKVSSRLARQLRGHDDGRPDAHGSPAHPTWLYCPSDAALARLPATIPGIRATSSWSAIVDAVGAEQDHAAPLRAAVYTAAPLQWLE
jgi:nickel-dependent lactate racemase